MRPSLTALLPFLLGALVTSASLLAAGIGCGRFGEEDPSVADGGPGAEGGVAVLPVTKRDVTVAAVWPTVPSLDPVKDQRVTKIRVVVTDATDSSRRSEISVASSERGPYMFPAFETTNLVDVTVELLADDTRLIGYGERRRWNLVDNATVSVNARRRLLYISSADRDNGQLRILGMTNPDQTDPALDEPAPPLPSLTEPSSLYVTPDGALLIQAGRSRLADAGAGAGEIAVIETGSHMPMATIGLSFAPSAVAPLGDGYTMLATPNDAIRSTTFALVHILARKATAVTTGLTGGTVDITSAAASPDGTRAIAVGSYTVSSKTKAYAFSYAAGASEATALDLSVLLDEGARAVRFLPEGKRVVIAGFSSAGRRTGLLLVYDALLVGSPVVTIPLAANTQPSSLVIHPNGKHAYISNQTQYSPACCGELRVVDLDTKAEVYASNFVDSAPEFELLAAVRLPYAPFRVLAGQSDNGNNVHGPVVELGAGGMAPTKVEVLGNGDIGSIDALATPFGTPF